MLATGSPEGLVRLWDTRTGSELGRLEDRDEPPKGSSAADRRVERMTFLADGRRLLCACLDNLIRLWDVPARTKIQSYRGHERVAGPLGGQTGVYAVALFPDERHFLSVGGDGTLRIWDLARGTEVGRLKGGSDEIKDVAAAPDGRHWAVAMKDASIRLWDGVTMKEVGCLQGHTGSVRCLAYAPRQANGRQLLVSGSWDSTVRVWDVAAGREVCCFSGHDGGVHWLAVAPAGQAVLSVAGEVRIWSLTGRSAGGTDPDHQGPLVCDALSADGRLIATGARDFTARVWDVQTGELLHCLRHDGELEDVRFSPDGRYLWTRSRKWDWSNQGERIWDLSTGTAVLTLTDVFSEAKSFLASPTRFAWTTTDHVIHVQDLTPGTSPRALGQHSDPVINLDASPDGRRLASASDDRTARLWDVEAGREVLCLGGHEGRVHRADFKDEGRKLVTTTSNYGQNETWYRLWDVEQGRLLVVARSQADSVCGVAFASDDRRLHAIDISGRVRTWDLTAALIAEGGISAGQVQACAFAPELARLACATDQEMIHILDLRTLQPLASWQGQGRITALAWSPDGRRLAVSSPYPTRVVILDASSGAELLRLVPEHSVNDLAFLADGRLATVAGGGEIALWDLEQDRRRLLAPYGSSGIYRPLACSSDGRLLALPDDRAVIAIRETDTGRRLFELPSHYQGIIAMRFFPHDTRLACFDQDHVLRIWEASTGELLAHFPICSDVMKSLAISADGRRLATGEWPGTVRLWDARSGTCTATCGEPPGAGWLKRARPSPPWRHDWSTTESSLIRTSDGRLVARFPFRGHFIKPLPDGRTWYGTASRRLGIFRLEGDPEP
jgi:WD40 repeat protein